MRLQFLQSVHLVKAPGHAAKDYKLGVHEVPSPVLQANHALIDKYVKNGWIVEGDAVKAVSLETPKERSLRLAEKLGIDVSKEKAALATASKKVEAPAEVESEEEVSEEESSESESESESDEADEAPLEDEAESEPSKKSKSKKRK